MRSTTDMTAGTRTGEAAYTDLDDVTRISIKVMGAVSGAIGVWAAVAMVVAMMHAGGPLALTLDWFGAVLGL